jgi:uncharacterized protein YdhG (YjbR/CyaY superfamily)
MAPKPTVASPKTKGQSAEVEAYLAGLPAEMRAALEQVRATVRQAAPAAVEVISYRMPAFRHDGRILVWYAGFAKHASFFPGSLAGLESLAPEMRPYAAAKGTLRFTPAHPIPRRLITRIVKARIAQQRREKR